MSEVYAFSAKLNAVKLLTGMIKAIQFKSVATCHIHEQGLTFTVSEHHCIKAVVYAKKPMFQNYSLQADDIPAFDIRLAPLVDCLGILCPSGNNDDCLLRYGGPGSHLLLTRREDSELKLTNTCKINTMDVEPDDLDDAINDTRNEQTVIMKASWLQDALGDLDTTCDKVSIVFSTQNPCFQLFGTGSDGTSSMTEYHEDHAEPFIAFDCPREGTYRYLYSYISHCSKALDQASDVSLKISKGGVLSLLFKIGSHINDDSAFVEFTILPCAE